MKFRFKFSLSCWTFFLITIFIFSTNSYANKFDFGVKEGDRFIWKCNVYNEEKTKKVLGKDWNQNLSNFFHNIGQDKKIKLSVKEICDDSSIYNPETNDIEKILVLEYNKWLWTEKDEWEEKDYVGQYTFFANPKDYPEDYIFPEFAPICVPLPYRDYLKGIDLYKGYSIETSAIYTINCEINKNDLEGDYPTEYIKILAMYNEEGIITSYKIYLSDQKVILEISLEKNSILEIINKNPFIPIVIAIIYMGLIYFIYKKILKS